MTSDSTRLIQAACRGDREAFNTLALRSARLVRAVIGRRVGPEAVDDLFQATYADAWERIYTLRNPGTFQAWLAQIAARHACDWLERRERSRKAQAQLEAEFVESYETTHGSGWSDRSRRALDALDPLSRSVVLLRLVKEQSAKEVAAALDMTPAAVDQRLARAKAELRKCLKSLEKRHEP